jgi:Ni/Fe-hydrogenase subunit HybB-like protein
MDLTFEPIQGKSRGYRIMIGVLVFMVAVLLTSFLVVYLNGQQVWGISNPVPWGQLITFDIYFIGLSAGAIVVSGLSYVLNRKEYKPIGRAVALCRCDGMCTGRPGAAGKVLAALYVRLSE